VDTKSYFPQPVLAISDDRALLDVAAAALGPRSIVLHVGARRPSFQAVRRANPSIVLLIFRDLSNAEVRIAQLHVTTQWPGVPTIICTTYSVDNLKHAADLKAAAIVDIDSSWSKLVVILQQHTHAIDLRGIATMIREVPHLNSTVAAVLSYALEAEQPVSTVTGLAVRSGTPLSTLRRRYRPIELKTGISLPDFLHASIIPRVAEGRHRGLSLSTACAEARIDPRTAAAMVHRLSAASLDDVTRSAIRCRIWFAEYIVRPIVSVV
jgi:hypothetical protein